MKQGTFQNGNKHDGREILIIIEDGYISFYFAETYFRDKEYVEKETVRRQECGEDPLTEDESNTHEFYGFEISRWNNPQEKFPEHISNKLWFSTDMLKFINDNAK